MEEDGRPRPVPPTESAQLIRPIAFYFISSRDMNTACWEMVYGYDEEYLMNMSMTPQMCHEEKHGIAPRALMAGLTLMELQPRVQMALSLLMGVYQHTTCTGVMDQVQIVGSFNLRKVGGAIQLGLAYSGSRCGTVHPHFFIWNFVKVRYCNGASFCSDSKNQAPQLYFHGQRIWLAAMGELMSKGMHYANQVGRHSTQRL
ncbi:hypothetical protein MLD38_036035 [Melastoma candidum]|uniref:Uncharacterized protein n=1 Tax=Melastoma candidum TaxID=119954 RepID=A0ACB9LIE5_9MYRT|nr:hypothetical protein MLD38_036035 [Melastoma candidum]